MPDPIENIDTLLDVANLRGVADKHCNVCAYHQSKLQRWCGTCKRNFARVGPGRDIVETCHHPRLDPDAEDGWPEVDGTTICDWFRQRIY